jgi:DNA invertase Pin-like site-specific DNA recombinase
VRAGLVVVFLVRLEQMTEVPLVAQRIADAWADTTTPHGRLMLTVLAGLAEFERERIKARMCEGRERAIASGIKFRSPEEADATSNRGSVGT